MYISGERLEIISETLMFLHLTFVVDFERKKIPIFSGT